MFEWHSHFHIERTEKNKRTLYICCVLLFFYFANHFFFFLFFQFDFLPSCILFPFDLVKMDGKVITDSLPLEILTRAHIVFDLIAFVVVIRFPSAVLNRKFRLKQRRGEGGGEHLSWVKLALKWSKMVRSFWQSLFVLPYDEFYRCLGSTNKTEQKRNCTKIRRIDVNRDRLSSFSPYQTSPIA